MAALDPLRTLAKSASVPLMYRLQAAILRSFQVLGAVMALAAGTLAVGLVTEGKDGALLSAGSALAMLGFVLLAGWMRKRAKKHADLFPPSVR